MAGNAQFRPSGPGDLADLEAMALALYREDPPGRRMSRRKLRATVAEFSAHPDKGSITIMQAGDAVVGYAIVVHFWSNEYGGNVAYIDELYVRPPWRNTGIGSSLIAHIAADREMAFRGMHLETTPANRRVLAFYRRNGFAPAKNRHMFRLL